MIGGHLNDKGYIVGTTEGIVALCEGLKGSAVTSLECAASPNLHTAWLHAACT